MKPYIITLDSTSSTNTYLSENAAQFPHGAVVVARDQTAGRGQRGNTWESAPGENITLSMLLRPQEVEAREQFRISEAVSLAIVETLDALLQPLEARIKWPNDIYVGDQKVCGILIENVVKGTLIDQSIVGIGLNVNQTQWLSDAPNPVSLRQLTGKEYRLDLLVEQLAQRILDFLDEEDIHQKYLNKLWRGEGEWPYKDTATGNIFTASIVDVEPDGTLVLSGSRRYLFKEVTFLLE
ncbi:MAG: biotin--[acetyl-CoA-carboxylase] ligase [Bacteroidales bacterium]|nr:biotin--[acetyl-CoA-carboxylase] ligase [Bacteroidales bacterium]